MLSILVPVYNEQGNISVVFEHLYKIFPAPHEIIIINDGSTDKTAEEIHKLPCQIINIPTNTGKGNAIRLGIAAAKGSYIGLIDGDGQDAPQDLLLLFQKAQQTQADLIIGSRFLNNTVQNKKAVLPLNAFGNNLITLLFNILFKTHLSDACASLRVFRATKVKTMIIQAQRYEIELEMLIRAIREHYIIHEMVVTRFARKQGKSNLYEIPFGRIRFGWRALLTMLKGFCG